MPPYVVTVRNNSEGQPNVALISGKAQVSGVDESQIWSHVVLTRRLPEGSEADLVVGPDMFAVMGLYAGSRRGVQHGCSTQIMEARPVTLGTKNVDGSLVPGTTFATELLGPAISFGFGQASNNGQAGKFEVNNVALTQGYKRIGKNTRQPSESFVGK